MPATTNAAPMGIRRLLADRCFQTSPSAITVAWGTYFTDSHGSATIATTASTSQRLAELGWATAQNAAISMSAAGPAGKMWVP